MDTNNIVILLQRPNILVDRLLGAVAVGIVQVKEDWDALVNPTVFTLIAAPTFDNIISM